MSSRVSKYLLVQDAISDYVGKVVSWITLLLILVLLFEVLMRYWFNSPTAWGHELSTMLFGALGIFAGSYALRYQAHVRSEVIYMFFPSRMKAVSDVIVYVLSLFAFLVFFKMSFDFAYESWKMGEISSKSTWQPVLYPIKSAIPVALVFLILQNVAELVRSVLKLFNVEFYDPREAALETTTETDR